ncbi:MAG: hypothetical protein WC974_09060 [Thermoplasmata archaeon]
MSYTNFPNGITSMGVPILGTGMPLMCGNVYFVDPDAGDDTHYDGKSADKPFATIDKALDSCTTNNDDVIVLSTNTTHTLTEMLTISINRVHFVGDIFGRQYGQRAKISLGVTTAVTDVFAVKNTGVGNTFTGIKFMCSNTLTQNVGTVGEGGEYAVYRNCEFYNSAKLTSDTHAELILNGDSAQFYNCTFGSLADAVSGDKIRPAVLLTAATVAAGKVSRDVMFDNCRFWKQAGGTTTAFIKGAAADVERIMEFHNCQFIANVLGAVPAVAIDVATLTVGEIILTGDTCAIECTKIATATGVINCTPQRVATATIGIQAT